MHQRQVCVAATRRSISDLVSNPEYCIAAFGGASCDVATVGSLPGDLNKMWHHNQPENALGGGSAGASSSIKHTTPGEIELRARRIRAMIIADTIADLVVATVRAVGWIASPLAAWWTRSRLHDELMSMDDRMLADIGISRADIPAVAAGSYRGETSGNEWRIVEHVRRLSRPVPPLAHNDRAISPRVA